MAQDNAKSKKVLHVEAGRPHPKKLHSAFSGEEWVEVRLDKDPSTQPNYTGHLRDLSMVPDGSMDAIWSRHNLQKLFYHEIPTTLAEFMRILKPEGLLMLAVPNTLKVAEAIVGDKLESPLFSSSKGTVSAIDMLYGNRIRLQEQGEAAAHHMCFTPPTIAKKLQEANFRNIQVRADGYNLWVGGHKLSQEHPQYNAAPNIIDYNKVGKQSGPKRRDELDDEPQQWTPLNLSKAG